MGERDGDIEGTGWRAGWIKVSAGDEGLTETETKVLRAAAEAAAATNAAIGSHNVRGRGAAEPRAGLDGPPRAGPQGPARGRGGCGGHERCHRQPHCAGPGSDEAARRP